MVRRIGSGSRCEYSLAAASLTQRILETKNPGQMASVPSMVKPLLNQILDGNGAWCTSWHRRLE